MLLTQHETSALRDLQKVTSPKLTRMVRKALKEAETDDISKEIGLVFSESGTDARDILNQMPACLRTGVRGIMQDGHETWRWLAWAWLRHHGTEFNISHLHYVSGGMAYELNVQWE